jgi:hypothetical protein
MREEQQSEETKAAPLLGASELGGLNAMAAADAEINARWAIASRKLEAAAKAAKALVVPAVYGAIAAVIADLSKVGIAKDRENKSQGAGFKFRGIDDVYNALSALLAKHGLVVLPRMLTRAITERESRNGGVLFTVVVEAEFDFVSALDGSRHTVRTFGEAMDSGDKATNKAMSAAYKYAAFQAFCIPTEGDNDADATTHEVAPSLPAAFPAWWKLMQATAAKGTKALEDAWKVSSPEFRRIVSRQYAKDWADLKQAAGQVKVDAEAAA